MHMTFDWNVECRLHVVASRPPGHCYSRSLGFLSFAMLVQARNLWSMINLSRIARGRQAHSICIRSESYHPRWDLVLGLITILSIRARLRYNGVACVTLNTAAGARPSILIDDFCVRDWQRCMRVYHRICGLGSRPYDCAAFIDKIIERGFVLYRQNE